MLHTLPTTPGVKVRYAQPEDFEQIVSMAHVLHEENGHMRIDTARAENAIIEAINVNNSVIGLVGPVGDVEGIVFLRFAQFWYSDEVFLEELFLYVRPDRRQGTGNARALITFAAGAAKRLGLPLFIGVLSSARTKAKLRLYRRTLGEEVGGYFFVGAEREKMGL